MKKLLYYLIFSYALGSVTTAQVQTEQTPDILINIGTASTDLVYRVSGKDGRLYQSYLGPKLENIASIKQLRDAGTWLMQPSVRIICLNRQYA
jgi:hypothetical protein